MTVRPGKLADRVTIMFQAQPRHALQDGVCCLRGGAGAVRILDAQQEGAAMASGEEPVEQGGSCRTDMHVARRRGGDPGDDRSAGGRREGVGGGHGINLSITA